MSSSESEHSSEDEDYVPNDAEHSGSDREDDKDEAVDKTLNDNENKEENEVESEKADELWKSFKEDTKSKKEPSPKSDVEKSTEKKSAAIPDESLLPKTNDSSKDTVTITKVYDFAGEDVKVTKEVKKDSKEAIEHLNQTSSNSSNTPDKPGISSFKKRPSGGIGNVLGKLGKKPKLSTLEKSKLDWNQYKAEEGIDDELKSYNKGKEGYLEKMSFLERTDMRQYQNERDIRQKISRR
uniref:craniofacial development protein 1-like isoform X2 n=1 Tax=Ciona intestinalis TaxID=7719 RepID=UPI000180C146|nr:craniofacial development protein 1-like isoform X2 [Ciona intestinalis]|eukprot:XP_002121927.1 craniofacial development protein 1-like isoform X2 [Ciona intestinalis]